MACGGLSVLRRQEGGTRSKMGTMSEETVSRDSCVLRTERRCLICQTAAAAARGAHAWCVAAWPKLQLMHAA